MQQAATAITVLKRPMNSIEELVGTAPRLTLIYIVSSFLFGAIGLAGRLMIVT